MGTRTLLAAALLLLIAPGCIAGARSCAPLPPPEPFAPLDARGLRIGVALGSGSMHGLAHVGVVQELEARGVDVQVVTGASAGAVIGSLWASGLAGDDIERIARRIDLDDLGSFARSFEGLLEANGLRAVLRDAFRDRPIERWPKRFGAVAANVSNGERRVLARGDGVVAVQASSATPVLFLPVTVRGERLVDGALVEPVPVEAARDLGADFVIAVDVAYRPHEEHASGWAQLGFQAMHILVNSLASAQLRSADVALRLNLHKHFTECGNPAVIAAGREAVRRAWPELLGAAAARRRR